MNPTCIKVDCTLEAWRDEPYGLCAGHLIEFLEKQLDRARSYKGIEGWPCPLCVYEKGKFIQHCEPHSQLQAAQETAQHYRRAISQFYYVAEQIRNWHIVSAGIKVKLSATGESYFPILPELQAVREIMGHGFKPLADRVGD